MSSDELSQPKSSRNSTSWKLPDGIENHLTEGVMRAASGVAIGGILGMILFRSGKGWRSGAVAAGLGVAVGSTYTRIINSDRASTQKIAVRTPRKVQTFATETPSLPK